MRKGAARRRRAGIVVGPDADVACRGLVANVIGRSDRDSRALLHRHAGAIDTWTIAGASEFFGPNGEIRVVVGGQTAAFFYIEKEDGAGREAFGLCGGGGIFRILKSDSFCRGFILELAALASAIQNQKTKAVRYKKFALPLPGVRLFAGRWA